MPLLHAIILGITQGLSEFLPISSSGHLILVPWVFGWNDFAGDADLEKAFDVALHIGTVVAVVAYFRRDLWRLGVAGLRSLARRRIVGHDERFAWLLVLSTIPGVIVGALFEDFITEHLGAEWLIGIMLIVFALVLAWADRLGGQRKEAEFSRRDAILMGVAQAAALQPGVSRSGATISMGRWLGFNRDAAARISFLMSTPITVGAAVYKVGELFVQEGGIPDGLEAAFIWGIVASALTGFVAIAVLLRVVRTRTFSPFVLYRVAVGAAVVALAASSLR